MTQSVSAVHASAATGITLIGVGTGLSFEILLAGFAGALVTLSYLQSMGWMKRLWSLFTSTLTAGYTAPTMGVYLSDNISEVFAGFIVGLAAQVAIPAFLKLVKRKFDNIEKKQGDGDDRVN